MRKPARSGQAFSLGSRVAIEAAVEETIGFHPTVSSVLFGKGFYHRDTVARGVGGELDTKSWKAKSKKLKTEVVALYLASKHPRTPWYAKVLAALIVGYALSPIDLIPDFIPVLGYLDDLIIVPAGIALLIKLIPRDVLEECRSRAQSDLAERKPKNWVAAVLIVLIWLLAIYLLFRLIRPIVFKTA